MTESSIGRSQKSKDLFFLRAPSLRATVGLMLHIKPTADPADVFRFKSNFIRFFRQVRAGIEKDKPYEAFTNEVGHDNGIHESSRSVAEEVSKIIEKHTNACRAEVVGYLKSVAQQLGIQL